MMMPWGKYKGQDIKTVPVSYLTWLWFERNERTSLVGREIKKILFNEFIQEGYQVGWNDAIENEGFGNNTNLSELSRKIKRMLSTVIHPDAGGTCEQMKRLNEACQVIESWK